MAATDTKPRWDEEASALVRKTPPFIVRLARRQVEKEAAARGVDVVTAALVREIAARYMPFARKRAAADSAETGGDRGDPLHHAFPPESLAQNHGSRLDEALSERDYPAAWRAAMASAPAPDEPRALYLHTPFCRRQCRFCGFFANVAAPDALSVYADAVIAEMRALRDEPWVRARPFDCVYLGGGTPTDYGADDLARLLAEFRRVFPLADDCEITVEGRIHDFTDDKVRACLDHGANRFSLGVQTFDTALRRSLGRVESREDAVAALRRLAAHDGAAVVIDLIYGLPGQTMAMWDEDLRTLDGIDLAGVDHYPLIVLPGTPLADGLARGTLPPAADAAGRADFFARGVEAMAARGARRLSVKHFGLNPRERNRYNHLQAYSGDCLPLGNGGGGRVDGHFFYQSGDLDGYYRAIAEGRKPFGLVCRDEPGTAVLRRIEGQAKNEARLDPARWQRETGFAAMDLPAFFAPLAERHEARGLLRRLPGGAAELTPAGQFWHAPIIEAWKAFFRNREKTREGYTKRT